MQDGKGISDRVLQLPMIKNMERRGVYQADKYTTSNITESVFEY